MDGYEGLATSVVDPEPLWIRNRIGSVFSSVLDPYSLNPDPVPDPSFKI